MNKLEKILGIKFPQGIKISHVTNSTDKVQNGSMFFGLKGTFNHGSKYINKALTLGASIAIHNDPSFKSTKSNIFFISAVINEWVMPGRADDFSLPLI